MFSEILLVSQAVLPLVFIAMIGYMAVRRHFFDVKTMEGLSKFVFDIAVPLMFLQVFATVDAPLESPWRLLVSYYVPVYIVYGLAMILALRRTPGQPRSIILSGYSAASGNIVLVGLPVISRLLGDDAYLPFMIIASIHPLMILTPSLLLLEMKGEDAAKGGGIAASVAKNIFRNPMILAMATGIALNLAGIGLPGFLDQTGQLMKAALTPCALFVLGAGLASYHIRGSLRWSLVIVMLKGVLLPALVGFLAFFWFEIEPMSAAVLVLVAAQPSALMSYVLSERYRAEQATTGTIILLSSILTVFTATGLAYLFHGMGIGIR